MKAVCLVTARAVEMDVEVVVVLPGSMAEFIAHAVSAVFKHMHKVRFAENSKCTENTAFVYRLKPCLKFRKGQRPTGRRQLTRNQEPVCRGFYAVLLK